MKKHTSQRNAQHAIDAVFSDHTISRSTCRQILEELADDIEAKLEALDEADDEDFNDSFEELENLEDDED